MNINNTHNVTPSRISAEVTRTANEPTGKMVNKNGADTQNTTVSVSKMAQMKSLIEAGQFKININNLANKLLSSGDLKI